MASSDPSSLLAVVHKLIKKETDLVAELTLVRKELKAARKALNDSNVAVLMAIKGEESESESEADKSSESESEEEVEGSMAVKDEHVSVDQPDPPPPPIADVAPQDVESANCDSVPAPLPRPSPVKPVSKAGACAPIRSIFGPVPAPPPPVPEAILVGLADASSAAKPAPVVEVVTPRAEGRPCKRTVVDPSVNAAIADVPVKRPRGRPPADPNGPCPACKYRETKREGGKPHNYGLMCSKDRPEAPVATVPKPPPALPAPALQSPAANGDSDSASSTSSESD